MNAATLKIGDAARQHATSSQNRNKFGFGMACLMQTLSHLMG